MIKISGIYTIDPQVQREKEKRKQYHLRAKCTHTDTVVAVIKNMVNDLLWNNGFTIDISN